MTEFSVALVASDSEQREVLRMLVEGTSIARARGEFERYPMATSDPVLRRMQGLKPDVVVIDIPADNPAAALRAIEMVHSEIPSASIFAMGSMNQPQVIVTAMRAGAREYFDRATTPGQLLEAFVRLSSSQLTSRNNGERGKIFTVCSAKGGCGATTVSVNMSLALQS